MHSDTAAVILAGGRGTRSADPTVAKLAQDVAGRTLLDWHVDLIRPSSIQRLVIVAGHLGDQVDLVAAPHGGEPLLVEVVHEEEQQGTVAALRLAAIHDPAERFLIILGDILMSFPVEDFLDAWRASGRSVAVAVHPSGHPEDSDAVFPLPDGTVVVRSKREERSALPNSSSAGLFAMTREGLNRYGHLGDVGSHVLAAAAEGDDLFAYISSHYFKDTGTPDRLAAARRDVDTGAFERRGALDLRPALFLDRDGVINPALPEVYAAADFRLNPGVGEQIGRANRAGLPVIVVTNQPGLAKGFMTAADNLAIRAEMDRQLAASGAFVDDYLFCPHHPETGFPGEVAELKISCGCRKPEPGMLLAAAAMHGLDLTRSVMVGDTERDAGAARASGTRYLAVDTSSPMGACDAIREAIEVLTC